MGLPNSILKHKSWKEVAPFIRIQDYRREGGNNNPRFRINLDRYMPHKSLKKFLTIQVKCAHCGHAIHPIRKKEESGYPPYFAATCPLNVNIACSRSRDASIEYKAIAKTVRGY